MQIKLDHLKVKRSTAKCSSTSFDNELYFSLILCTPKQVIVDFGYVVARTEEFNVCGIRACTIK